MTVSGIERITQAFQKEGTAFMPYAVLGYPNEEGGLETVRQLVRAGADLLELGVPFSDPLADGPTIQAATQQSLAQGTTLQSCFKMVRQLRQEGVATPALLMSYVNPILAYGVETAVAEAAVSGIDGFIVPDLPPEEADELDALCHQHGLALIYFLAPTSTPERIAQVTQKARGFLYLVAITGITGVQQNAPAIADFVAGVRQKTSLPLAIGFGIGNGAQAAAVSRIADGVIVGSALVKQAARSPEAVYALATELRQAMG